MRFLSPKPTPPCGLGIDALPTGLGCLPLGTPVALAMQDRTPDRQWLQSLLQDMLQGGPVFLLTENQAQADALLQQPALQLAHTHGRLLVWLMGADLAFAKRPSGLQPVLDELAQAGLTRAHALLVLAAPAVHFGSSVASVQQWGRQWGHWCRRRTRPVVMAFNQWTRTQEVLAPLRTLAHVFEHVAVLGSEAKHTLLYVERWNGTDGPVFEARLGLANDTATQRLVYDGSRVGSAQHGAAERLVEAPDQYTVIATQAAVAGQRGIPHEWTLLAQRSEVLGATRHAIAATVLLDAGPTHQQQELLQLVHQLRSTQGRALKIVVRETQDKLRANLEQALLSLGANAVVYREVGFARLQKVLEDLRDETFVRAIPADFAQALAGFMPDPLRGYLPAAAFCDSVQAMLARTSHIGLKHCFLRLSMQPHVAHLDAIQACTAARDGDVLSADEDALYVFMFACSESDLDPALARLFSIAPSELFAAQTLYASEDGVHRALHALREAAGRGVPDYSAYRSERATPAASHNRAHGSGTPVRPSGPVPAPALAATQPDAAHARAQATPTPAVHARPLVRSHALPPQGELP